MSYNTNKRPKEKHEISYLIIFILAVIWRYLLLLHAYVFKPYIFGRETSETIPTGAVLGVYLSRKHPVPYPKYESLHDKIIG